ncbi:unnamed protein product [Dibothriocephalus latus]|uniref:Uncharacterized protein n=1 Tax=Dibothriocephalus latus TaxID=60516 RepID=A0A3P7QZB5_DIBLA|nr:unnamed protein product [Dibothriocephalus latus]
MHETLKKLEEDILQRNDLVNKLETEIHHSNIAVQRQQAKIDTLNKKLEQLVRDRGGVELGPLEIMLNHLTKGIAAKNDEIGSLEQQWLKEQTDLVKHQENKLAEEDFVRALREKEQETVEMQSKLDAVIKEKEELLSELIETE